MLLFKTKIQNFWFVLFLSVLIVYFDKVCFIIRNVWLNCDASGHISHYIDDDDDDDEGDDDDCSDEVYNEDNNGAMEMMRVMMILMYTTCYVFYNILINIYI